MPLEVHTRYPLGCPTRVDDVARTLPALAAHTCPRVHRHAAIDRAEPFDAIEIELSALWTA
jgi:hypothetical protein